MKLNMEQTETLYLTMKLDLKMKEYKNLCDELEKNKENEEQHINLLKKFKSNKQEIEEIRRLLHNK